MPSADSGRVTVTAAAPIVEIRRVPRLWHLGESRAARIIPDALRKEPEPPTIRNGRTRRLGVGHEHLLTIVFESGFKRAS
jgi:hypothetical protein